MSKQLQTPAWLPAYIPALDGLRGLAVLLVLCHHCLTEFKPLHLGFIAAWGWTGVNLFFVLSGFLITGIILDARADPHFFRNFYARRTLRIWPVYFVLLPFTYFVLGPANMWIRPTTLPFTTRGVPWLYFIFFVQNLRPGMAGTIFPTWSLAIEEQFYFCWAPVARKLNAAALTVVLLGALVATIWCRMHLRVILAGVPEVSGEWAQTNSVFKLDGLAIGGLIALGMRARGWSRRVWGSIGLGAMAVGIGGWIYALYRGGPYFDALVGIGFGGMVIAGILAATRPNFYSRVLTAFPLRRLGTISYALYLFHMPVFALLGGIDHRLESHGARGALAIVLLRWSCSIAVAALSWRFFERPILKLKRYFMIRPEARARTVAAAG